MELLEEIEEERRKEALPIQELHVVEDNGVDNDIVLVTCKNERSCLQMEDSINKGPKKVMWEEWEKYLLGKADLHILQKGNKNKKRSQDPKDFGILNGVASTLLLPPELLLLLELC